MPSSESLEGIRQRFSSGDRDFMSVKTRFSSNGHSPNGRHALGRDELDEMADVVRWEMGELRAGRTENVLLIDALANQWSAEHIIGAAQQRGKNWRFLAALADKALQAQGIGLLVAVTEATGMDVTEQLMRKSYNVIDRLDCIYREHVRQHGENPYKAQIYDEARQGVVDNFMQGKNLYYQQAGRLILQMLGG